MIVWATIAVQLKKLSNQEAILMILNLSLFSDNPTHLSASLSKYSV